uniref:Uncharacterized protein n=1 Tax=Pipistrellus kuhlii TaxID=59472 RepID=A0A7J7TXI8_PIPKU|nr:hypothetical protein mPipKuh1_009201 [Pipistrellus kuhlii]
MDGGWRTHSPGRHRGGVSTRHLLPREQGLSWETPLAALETSAASQSESSAGTPQPLEEEEALGERAGAPSAAAMAEGAGHWGEAGWRGGELRPGGGALGRRSSACCWLRVVMAEGPPQPQGPTSGLASSICPGPHPAESARAGGWRPQERSSRSGHRAGEPQRPGLCAPVWPAPGSSGLGSSQEQGEALLAGSCRAGEGRRGEQDSGRRVSGPVSPSSTCRRPRLLCPRPPRKLAQDHPERSACFCTVFCPHPAKGLSRSKTQTSPRCQHRDMICHPRIWLSG